MKNSRKPSGAMVVIAGISLYPAESGMAVMNRLASGTPLHPQSMEVVDISMCRQMSEMRQFSLRKVGRLLVAPFKLIAAGLSADSKVLYFVPSAPSLGGVVKDAWILLISKLWFRHRIYHCHSGGVGIYLKDLPGFVGKALRWIICQPAAVIKVSESAPNDDIGFSSKQRHVVPNCITDEEELLSISRTDKSPSDIVNFLFIGLHSESKGFLILLQAFKILLENNKKWRLVTVGSFNNPAFELMCRDFITKNNLHHYISFSGPKFGEAKVEALRTADALVFPTHFECETFGLVVAESMAAGIPAVASDWSGLRDLILNGETGYLTEIKNPESVAAALAKLCADPVLRRRLGMNARKRFVEKYSQTSFEICFRNVINKICTAKH